MNLEVKKMETPDEMVANWKKLIEEQQDENMLNIIKLDLEAEKDLFEDTVRDYENLIGNVEDKIEKCLKGKQNEGVRE